ncbi:hypothetical protein BGZ80_008873 [Entomortierella chlamydospora]|uniref:F-box domain-containing protein n=1 Tax=Entomortierella chlamydospora TaxID=101097 RepID=A0A9P6MY87_9FUNG|nr:hypothetical protein BGZ80_008873 [Entomortierella chlamydospora]
MSMPGSLPQQHYDRQLKIKDALSLIGPYLYSHDIARCCLVCRFWSKYFKPLLWWNAVQRVDTQFHRQKLRAKAKTRGQNQKIHQQQGQQQPKVTMSEELFEEIFLPYFQYNFERGDLGTIQACVEFKTTSRWAVEILEASGCDTLQRLDIRRYGYHELSPMACPNLQQLRLVDIHLADQNIEEPFWFFPTSVVTPNSSPRTSSPDQFNQQPISPSDAYFKNLKRVVLIGLEGKYISAHEQVQFLRSLPALESIEFGIGGYCAVYGLPKWQPKPSTNAARIPDFQFEKVKTFDVTLKTAPQPRKLARIFGLFPPGKCTSVHFCRPQINYTDHRYVAEHTGDKFDLEWPGGLLLHKDTLRDVSIQGSELSSLEPTLLEILQNCPRLKRLEVMDRTSIALKCTVDNLSVPWVCSELEVLDVFMDCTHSNESPSGVNNNLCGIDMVTPSFLQTQRVLFERLASLPNLRKLAICRGGGDIPSVDFSLKTGLGILSTLTKLEELDVRVIGIPEGGSTLFLDDDVVYRVCENLSVEDAVWMVEHWQALKVVRGTQWNDGTTTLKNMLTEQRSDMVFDGY